MFLYSPKAMNLDKTSCTQIFPTDTLQDGDGGAQSGQPTLINHGIGTGDKQTWAPM